MLAECMEGKVVYEHQKTSSQILDNANCYDDPFPDRVDYDLVGEDLRDQCLVAFNKSTQARYTITEQRRTWPWVLMLRSMPKGRQK